MSSDSHTLIGYIAGVISFLGFAPYIIATIKGKNRPNRATWMIWFLVSIILLVSYQASGGTHTLWVMRTNVLFSGTLALLSWKYGASGWSALDVGCLIGALFGLLLWWFFDSPLPTLYISIGIDIVGAIPTVKKSWKNPFEEDRLTWILFWVANTLNLFAMPSWSVPIASYPVYLFLISGVMTVLLVCRSHSKNKDEAMC